MNFTVELSSEEKEVIRKELKDMSPLSFMGRLVELNLEFAKLNHRAALVALEMKMMTESCKHPSKSELSPYAWKCSICGHVDVDTRFSAETEAWFKELNRRAAEENPMRIIPSNAELLAGNEPRQKNEQDELAYELLIPELLDEKDFETVKNLLTELSGKPSDLTPDRYKEFSTNGMTFVARLPDNRIVGMVSLIAVTKLSRVAYWVEDVVVDPAYRGRGICEALMNKIEHEALQCGFRKLDLHTSRPNAARLYEKLGYEKRESTMYQKFL